MKTSTSFRPRRTDLGIALAIAFVAACIMAALAFVVPARGATKPNPAPAAMPAASEPEMHTAAAPPTPTTTLGRVRSTGRIVFGYRPDAMPMSYRDASGQAAGYSVALCNKVADMLRRDLSLPSLAVEWVAIGADFGDVEQQRVDLVCASDEITLTNRARASFSIPIFPGGVSALVRADVAQSLQRALEERRPAYAPLWRGTPPPTLEHRTYSALVGSTTIDALQSRIANMRLTANVEPVASYEAGLAAVVKGSTDVLFGDRAQLLQAVQRSAAAKELRVLAPHYTFAALALALARNDDDFRLAVDRALTRVYEDPQFGALYATTFGTADPDTVAFFRSVAVPK